MSARRIWTIFLKDLIDAIRDARVLVAVIVPIGIGVFYSFSFDDDDLTVLRATVVYASADQSTLPAALREAVSDSVELRLYQVADAAAVSEAVDEDEADLGLVIPAGFDAAARAGRQPPLDVILPHDPTLEARYVAAALEPAVRTVAGQTLPAQIETATPAASEESESIFERLGIRSYMVLASVLFLVVMVAMVAIPVVLAEETEKKTLDALVMIASYLDVIVAKALLGVTYIASTVVIQLVLTRLDVADTMAFAATITLLATALVGFGLLLGSVFKNANQLNTWSGFLLLPVVAPIFVVGLPVPDVVERIIQFIPTSAGMRLAANAVTGERVFDAAWLSYVVIATWGTLAYLLLAWRLNRRQA